MLSLRNAFKGQTATPSRNNDTNLSKRGLVYIETDHESDYNIFTSASSPLTWYYNFSPWPSLPSQDRVSFIPMIHGTDSAEDDISTIKSLDSITHVLVFNEPDGSTSSGGSNIPVHEAAKVYLDSIAPLRRSPHNLRLSLPATTGSPNGLDWLQDFNTSCYDLNPSQGCEFDFLAAHWYGDFPSLASWLGTLHDLYPSLPIWVTEFALPQTDEEAALEMLEQSLPFLDGLEYVERYAWFGTFRSDEANEWTGGGVSLLDGRGGLTELGARYLGGEARGFEVGDRAAADANDAAAALASSAGVSSLVLVVALLVSLVGGFV